MANGQCPTGLASRSPADPPNPNPEWKLKLKLEPQCQAEPFPTAVCISRGLSGQHKDEIDACRGPPPAQVTATKERERQGSGRAIGGPNFAVGLR